MISLVENQNLSGTRSLKNEWLLEGCLPGQEKVTRIKLGNFPFTVGRDTACDLLLASRNVSKRHASILLTASAAFVQDNSSTNGTFVNGRRIAEPTPVGVNDLIQFADVELRLICEAASLPDFTCVAQQPQQNWLISRLGEVLNNRRLRIHFQPIVRGPEPKSFGYEALVRTDVEGLETPFKLFQAAHVLGQECRLSEMCRSEAVRVMDEAGTPGVLFLNTDPNEKLDGALVESMKSLRDIAGDRQLVLEVHEEAVPEMKSFRAFAEALRDLNIQLAFDDFGAGQSRLLELAQVRPDYLKFDRSLVKDLGTSVAMHTVLVRSLHESATALGIQTLAEGLETPESVNACREIGFHLYQGYAFGRPAPL
jgi:EAL domain-containing protein (putative c-di-GMP-specific phosphodiesterase class I)